MAVNKLWRAFSSITYSLQCIVFCKIFTTHVTQANIMMLLTDGSLINPQPPLHSALISPLVPHMWCTCSLTLVTTRVTYTSVTCVTNNINRWAHHCLCNSNTKKMLTFYNLYSLFLSRDVSIYQVLVCALASSRWWWWWQDIRWRTYKVTTIMWTVFNTTTCRKQTCGNWEK